MDTILKTDNLGVGYGRRTVLSDICVSAVRGSLTALVGANGSGKSTLLRTLSGAQKPTAGSVHISGFDLASLGKRARARLLAMVSTDRTGAGALTVRETVEIGRHPHTGPFGRLDSADNSAVAKALADVGMEHYADRLLGTLSDGERQKVMLARALAQDTPLIILDEPTAFLDVAGKYEINRLLRSLADNGHTIILSTHDIASSVEAADTIWVVDHSLGHVVAADKASAISSGMLDRAFPSLRFDPSTLTFRSAATAGATPRRQ